ncbi:MAG: SMC family ATPase [Acetobacter sp.]|nr:SMC family ATPase [Bacteroides sp.]MCM1340250.1 SMC family ATPase [Acetobacter sp.]MCM1432798.1 SMC family ATPase [Clostridiales bacterium]
MRPVKLVMSAFGPYANEETVNFEIFGNNGIYLITGDTGAGKTTIFDAITYALFGEPSGDNRKANMFRSKYAKEDTKTFVELTFDNNGERYFVKRVPEYDRPAKRGNGTVKQSAEAEMIMPDKAVITKPKEVNDKIIDIIGVNKNQFSQIAMIAQGDFLKLILAKTTERQAIFREIFKTQFYEKMQYKIKNEAIDVNKKCKEYSDSIRQYAVGIECASDNPMIVALEDIKKNGKPVAEILAFLDKLIDYDSVKQEEAYSKLSEYNNRLDELKTQKNEAAKANENKKKYDENNKALKILDDKKTAAESLLKQAKDFAEDVESTKEKVTILQQSMVDYDELEDKKKHLNSLQKKLEGLERDNTVLKENCESIEKKIAKYNGRLNIIGSPETVIAECTAKKENEEQILKKIEMAEVKFSDLKTIKEKLKSAQDDFKAKSDTYNIVHNEYEIQYQLYLDSQAGLLASSLKEGEPCSVCGSVHHPNPAKAPDKAPTKAELDAKKNEDEKARSARESAGNKAREINVQKESTFENLNEMLANDFEISNFDNAENSIRIIKNSVMKSLASAEDILTESERLKKEKAVISKILPELEKNIDENKIKFNKNNLEITALNTEIRAVGETIKKLSKKLEFDSKAQLSEKINSLNNIVSEKNSAVEKSCEGLNSLNNQLAELQGKQAELIRQLENSKELDIDEIQLQLKDFTEKYSVLDNERQKINIRLSNNNNVKTNIFKKYKGFSELEKKRNWLNALDNTANGKVQGKEKIMLETYVQMSYFDDIIKKANTRFMKMSDGQYELVRSTQAENNKIQSGLELDVIDHYNGTVRSIKTLSGGESFKASLSLALGLSDEVQSESGGIKIDTMFIDEGFGSLDEESLEQAIKTLVGIGGSNRLVGIISHVPQLKERIDKQIIVTKDYANGSYIRQQ